METTARSRVSKSSEGRKHIEIPKLWRDWFNIGDIVKITKVDNTK